MLRFRGSVITSDGGLLAYRELDDAVGLTDMAGDVLADARTGKNGRHVLVGLLRQSVFGRLADYEEVNGRRAVVPRPGNALGGRRPSANGSGCLCQPDGRFETEWLARPENLAALAELPGRWVDTVHKRRPPRIVVLDMDWSQSPTYGDEEGSADNGHFGCTCYHPLFVFNQLGDLERCALRSGNLHSADGWREVLEPVIARSDGRGRGAAADVPRDPDADRAVAGAACPGMTGLWGRTHGSRWERRALLNAKQPVPAPRGRKLIASAPALCRRRRNSLPRSAKSETIALTDPGIRRMSA
jgi:hypothetical protein